MTNAQVWEWAYRERAFAHLTMDEIEHVVDCLYDIVLWYWEKQPVGDFLTAVLKNDFMQACGCADSVNGKVLPLYAKFLYNNIPMDFRKRIK